MNTVVKYLGLYTIYKLAVSMYGHANYYQQPYVAIFFLFVGIIYCLTVSFKP